MEREEERVGRERAGREREGGRLGRERAAREREVERLGRERAAREREVGWLGREREVGRKRAAREREIKRLGREVGRERVARGRSGYCDCPGHYCLRCPTCMELAPTPRRSGRVRREPCRYQSVDFRG